MTDNPRDEVTLIKGSSVGVSGSASDEARLIRKTLEWTTLTGGPCPSASRAVEALARLDGTASALPGSGSGVVGVGEATG